MAVTLVDIDRVMTEVIGTVVRVAVVVTDSGHRDHSVRGGHRDDGDLRAVGW